MLQPDFLQYDVLPVTNIKLKWWEKSEVKRNNIHCCVCKHKEQWRAQAEYDAVNALLVAERRDFVSA